MPRFAANLTLMFTEVPMLDRFAAAVKAGFRAVECQLPYAWPADEIKRRLDDARLTMVLINAPAGDWDKGDRGLAALPGREDDFRDGIERAIDYARAFDCPRVHAMAGLVPPDADGQRVRETYVRNLRDAAATCRRHDIRLVIEAINTIDIPNYYLCRPSQALDVLSEVGHDNLYLLFDIYHAQMSEGRLAATIESNIRRIGHVQIAGVPGRHEPIPSEINYPYLFGLLDRLGYDGWIGCEYKPKGGTAEGLGWRAPYEDG